MDLPRRSWQTLNERISAGLSFQIPLAPLVRHTHGSECSLWPTPLAADGEGGIMWGNAKDYLAGKRKRASGHNMAMCLQLRVPILEITVGRERRGGKVNPELSEWLMGWPLRWTALDAAATAWFRARLSPPSKNSKRGRVSND